jgi:hypothetical protein
VQTSRNLGLSQEAIQTTHSSNANSAEDVRIPEYKKGTDRQKEGEGKGETEEKHLIRDR